MTVIFNDTFTEASANVELNSHTPDTGTGWTRVFQDGANPLLQAEFTPDTCGATTQNNSACAYTADATYPSADYEVQWTIVNANGFSTRPFYVFVRYQDSSNMYAVRGSNTASGYQLYTKVAGSWTAVGSAVTVANGSVCKLQIIGTALKLFDDTVEVASATVADISAAGKAGLASGGGGFGTDSNDDSNGALEIDNFSVTDLGGGGTVYEESVSGAMTPAGAILKSASKFMAGANTPAGTLTKTTSKSAAGTITPAGVLSRMASKLFGGALTSAGELTSLRLFVRELEGTLTSAGVLIRNTAKSFSGSLPSAGAVVRSASKFVAGALSSSGVLSRLSSKTFGGTLTSAGVLGQVRTFVVNLSGSLSSAGAISRAVSKSLSGSLTPTGGIIKSISKFVSGAITSIVGTLSSVLSSITSALNFGRTSAVFEEPQGLSFEDKKQLTFENDKSVQFD